MTPFYADPRATLWQGDCRAVMAAMAPASVHCVVTSPPYLGLRAYAGEQEQVWDGDPSHEHTFGDEQPATKPNQVPQTKWQNVTAVSDGQRASRGAYCECGSWRGALGLEPSIGLYVKHIVEVMRGVRRVMRDDATLWLSLGDSYAGGGGYSPNAPSNQPDVARARGAPAVQIAGGRNVKGYGNRELPEKSLMMIPARVAIAMQDDGWVLRSDIAWCKTSAMPESVTDRPSSAWEHIFLFAKRGTYFYDQEAVRQKHVREWDERNGGSLRGGRDYTLRAGAPTGHVRMAAPPMPNPTGANLRNYWLLGPEPFPEAHFATFPTEIPRRAILAGTSAHGCCGACGAPWRRMVDHRTEQRNGELTPKQAAMVAQGGGWKGHGPGWRKREQPSSSTLGWEPTCAHMRCITCGFVLDLSRDSYSRTTIEVTRQDVPALREGLLDEASGAEILRPGLRGQRDEEGQDLAAHLEGATEAVPVLREDVQAGLVGHRPLQQEVRRDNGGPRQAEFPGLVQDHQGLHPGLPTGPSERGGNGLRHGAPPRDGAGIGAVSTAGRGGASPQQDQGRQPARESDSPSEARPRRLTTSTVSRDLSELSARIPDGWACPRCGSGEGLAPPEVVPATVLDIFAGSGTTLMVARSLGRIGLGAELSEEYCRMAQRRIQGQTLAMALG